MALPRKFAARRDQMRLSDLGVILDGMPLVLVGLPGSGKTTAGRRMAEIAKLPFLDADEEIEAAMDGLSIGEFIARHGEERFRNVEQAAVLEMLDRAQGRGQILALGGGAFARWTREAVAKRTVSVWLKIMPAEILKRIDPTSRPLLARAADPAAELERLAALREADYAHADVVCRVGNEDLHDTVCSIYSELVEAVRRQPDDADPATVPVLI